MRRLTLVAILLGICAAPAADAGLVAFRPDARPSAAAPAEVAVGSQLPAREESAPPSNDSSTVSRSAPSSLSLALCALVSLSAAHVARSLRKVHFGVAPEWYSTSGPQQVGYSTPFELGAASICIAPFESLVLTPQLIARRPLTADHIPAPPPASSPRSPRAPPLGLL